jgi:hypothetical protein
MANATAVAIDWASASVKDSRLTVAFSEPPPKGWADELESVIARLRTTGRGWGEISAGKRKLHVEAVQSGAEEDLRHFLESAVLQANAALELEREPDEGDGADEPAGPDEAMAAVFRSFA